MKTIALLIAVLFLYGCPNQTTSGSKKQNKPILNEKSRKAVDGFLKNFGLITKKTYDKSQEEVSEWKQIARKTPECSYLSPNAKVSKNTNLLISPKDGSEVISKISKNDKIAIISRLQNLPEWYLVYNKKCEQGYVKEASVAKLINYGSAKINLAENQNIVITDPQWTSANLIQVKSDGFVSITGAVNKKNGINKVMINNEEVIIESDNSFSTTLNVPKKGLQVRVVAFNNATKIQNLTFDIKVKN